MSYSYNDILVILDEGAENFYFPMLDNEYFYLGKIIMKVFRSKNEWLIAFQELAFAINDRRFVNSIMAFGNMIKSEGVIEIKEIFSQANKHNFFDSKNKFILNPFKFKIIIKDIERNFNISIFDYKKFGIDINDKKTPNEAKIIRYLSSEISSELFFSSNDILYLLNIKNSKLKIFIELEDWNHPNLAIDEMPSENQCFVNLAKALEKNDKTLFKCPKDLYNTHWSNWEWYKE